MNSEAAYIAVTDINNGNSTHQKQLKLRFSPYLAAFMGYFIASCIVFHSIISVGIYNSQPKMGSGDYGLAVSNIAWLPFAILHGKNIFFSNYQFALRGINMMSTPAYFTQALIMSPVTIIFGPVFSTNLAIILGPVVTGFSAFVVYFKITASKLGSFLAGLVLGFSILVINDSIYGHFHVTWIFGPPVIFYAYYKLIRVQNPSILKYGIWLGIVFVLQFYASVELLFTSLFFYTLFGIFLLLIRRSMLWPKLWEIVKVTTIGAVFSLLFCGYGIYFFVAGKDHVFYNNGIYSNPVFKLSIADLFIPLDKLNLNLNLFSNNFAKIAMPIVPMLIILVTRKYLWKKPLVRYSLLFSIVIYLCMIGSNLRIVPMQNLIPNPIYYLFMHIPIISATLFVRYCYFFMFFINFGFILGMERLYQIKIRNRSAFKPKILIKSTVAVLLILNLFWMDSHFFDNQQPIPSSTLLSSDRYIPKNAIIWVYPRATISNGNPLIYLAQSGFHYRITSGYGFESIHGIPSFFLRLSPIDKYIYYQLSSKGIFIPSNSLIMLLRQYVRDKNIKCVTVTDTIKNKKIVSALTLVFNKPKLVGSDAIWYTINS